MPPKEETVSPYTADKLDSFMVPACDDFLPNVGKIMQTMYPDRDDIMHNLTTIFHR